MFFQVCVSLVFILNIVHKIQKHRQQKHVSTTFTLEKVKNQSSCCHRQGNIQETTGKGTTAQVCSDKLHHGQCMQLTQQWSD